MAVLALAATGAQVPTFREAKRSSGGRWAGGRHATSPHCLLRRSPVAPGGGTARGGLALQAGSLLPAAASSCAFPAKRTRWLAAGGAAGPWPWRRPVSVLSAGTLKHLFWEPQWPWGSSPAAALPLPYHSPFLHLPREPEPVSPRGHLSVTVMGRLRSQLQGRAGIPARGLRGVATGCSAPACGDAGHHGGSMGSCSHLAGACRERSLHSRAPSPTLWAMNPSTD